MSSFSGARRNMLNSMTAKNIISNKVLGMLIFVFTEVMFFTALISAFLVIKGDAPWSIPHGVRLPILATAYNTMVLLFSGGCLSGQKKSDRVTINLSYFSIRLLSCNF